MLFSKSCLFFCLSITNIISFIESYKCSGSDSSIILTSYLFDAAFYRQKTHLIQNTLTTQQMLEERIQFTGTFVSMITIFIVLITVGMESRYYIFDCRLWYSGLPTHITETANGLRKVA